MRSVTQFLDRRTITALAVAAVVSLPASADDLDVYTGVRGSNFKPNILLVLDYSGSMNGDINGNRTDVEEDRKISILKKAVNDLMNKYEDDISLGLGSLYDRTPSGVRWPISSLSEDPHSVDSDIPANKYSMREVINAQLDQRSARGSTNTVGALADAALYFQGGLVTHNDQNVNDPAPHAPDSWNDTDAKYDGGTFYSALPASYVPNPAYIANAVNNTQTTYCRNYAKYSATGENYCEGIVTLSCEDFPPGVEQWDHDDNPNTPDIEAANGGFESCEYETNTVWNQPQYISPIVHECQKNFMILISDGLPRARTEGATLRNVLGVPDNDPIVCEDLSTSVFSASGETSGNCGKEILHRMATMDQVDGIKNSTVSTYTIGFSITGEGQAFLEELADAGKGKFAPANSSEELDKALADLVDQFLVGSENFAELSIDLDKANFSHDNRAYFSLFQPSYNRSWRGNTKGYFVTDAGLMDINNQEAVVLADGKTQFADTAQSFWSTDPDGNNTLSGGASEHVITGSRNLYTFTGNTNNISGIGEDLTTAANSLDKNNTAITQAMLNNPADSDALLDWLQTAPMGDALHTKVVTADYGNQVVAYTVTNQGFLHAIDATTPVDITAGDTSGGNELFAFMPQELLANLPALKENRRDPGNHIYGLDGQITPVHTDRDGDGVVEPADGDKLVLVFGMRRGGNTYYAVNVTDPNSPRLEWQIKGGVAPFENLAQTWSRMSLISASTGPNPEDKERVLAFTGGYDAAVVDGTDGDINASGNAIYVVDLDGNYIWSTHDNGTIIPGMDHSIPSDLTIIDTDGDTKADRMYVGDTGGNVWRVDFDRIRTKSEYDVKLFASLQNDAGGNQPFFYPPSIALNSSSAGDFLSVSIASGNRTNPLELNVNNAIYMMRDKDTRRGGTAPTMAPIILGSLYDATTNDVASSDPDVAADAKDKLSDVNNNGWYVKLDDGEKGLSALVSFEGNLMATTYTPTVSDPGAILSGDALCSFESTGALYIMDIADGRPVKYLDDGSAQTDGLVSSDRKTELTGTSIPSSPVPVFPKGSSQVNIIVDKESVSTVSQRLRTVFWHSQ